MSVSYKDENGLLQKGAGLYKSEVPIGIADIYTESERRIGLWKDGKPLYQKSFNFPSGVEIAMGSWTDVNSDIPNNDYDKIVRAFSIDNNGTYQGDLLCGINSSDHVQLQSQRNGSGNITANCITIQYTKTTDTESSIGMLPASASALYMLGDVEISDLQDGDVLKYDETDNIWKNGEGGSGNANMWTGTQAELEEVFDELEEGTLINITDDEQEVVEGGTIYSEEEQCIGLWLDKKPLYQKSIKLDDITVPQSSRVLISLGTYISNIDNIIKGELIVIEGSTNLVLPSFQIATMAQYGLTYTINKTDGIVISRGSDSGTVTRDFIATVYYTKTTDAPLDVVVGKRTMYIASSDCYSTEEKEIGCWTDGKPLYQKTFIHEGTYTGTNTNLSISIPNAETAFIVNCWAINANNATFNLSYAYPDNATNNVTAFITSDKEYLGIRVGSNQTIKKLVTTIQYTKTTDTAGSGQYTPASGKAEHYSTNEEVIGTWIDGKPLYRKVYTITSLNLTANSWSATDIADPNISEFIDAKIHIAPQGTTKGSLHEGMSVGIVNGYVSINYYRNLVSDTAKMLLEYTKTTD